MQELFGVLISPYVFIFVMPPQADTIIQFVNKITLNVPELGAVCGYSLFDLRKYGAGPLLGVFRLVIAPLRCAVCLWRFSGNKKYGGTVTANKDVRSRQGKMEKSMLSFCANNPDWATGSEASTLLGGLRRFQEEQTSSSAHGGGLMMDASIAELGGAAALGGGLLGGGFGATASMSLQSLAVPLGTSRYLRQENYFYWLNRVRVARCFFAAHWGDRIHA